MTLAAVLFALAALGGLTMAVIRFKGAPQPPLAIAVIHGLAAASGIIALLLAVTGSDGNVPGLAKAALVIFVLAALGGLTLLTMHLKGKALPKPLVLAHGAIAVTAFTLLLIAITGR